MQTQPQSKVKHSTSSKRLLEWLSILFMALALLAVLNDFRGDLLRVLRFLPMVDLHPPAALSTKSTDPEANRTFYLVVTDSSEGYDTITLISDQMYNIASSELPWLPTSLRLTAAEASTIDYYVRSDESLRVAVDAAGDVNQIPVGDTVSSYTIVVSGLDTEQARNYFARYGKTYPVMQRQPPAVSSDKTNLIGVSSPSKRLRFFVFDFSLLGLCLSVLAYTSHVLSINIPLTRLSHPQGHQGLSKRWWNKSFHPEHSMYNDQVTALSNRALPISIDKLWNYRSLSFHKQSPEEAQQIQRIAFQLKTIRKDCALSLTEFAKRVGVASELLIIVECGDGDLETAQSLLQSVKQVLNI